MTFNDFKFNSKLLKGIKYDEPTAIQLEAIPLILEGCDLQASAQTGTGKTAAFMLPILHKLTEPSNKPGKGPRVLILVPTRELAIQVTDEAKKYSAFLPEIRTVSIFGGVPYEMQNRQLSRPFDILIATPGRLIDQLDRGRINFDRIEVLILDEADRMLDMGFFEPVELIAEATPKDRQTLMFSATLKGPVLQLSRKLLRNPREIRINPQQTSQVNVEQRMHYVDNMEHKLTMLDHLLKDPEMNHAIVFTSTKVCADQLVDYLYDKGHQAAKLHGDMNQRQRTRTISKLREGKHLRVLVATDVVSRGIDVQTITHVINFDLPRNAEDYVHRIGRTGRAGAKGIAVSFVSRQDMMLLNRIEKFTNEKITAHEIPGMEPKVKPSPVMPKRMRGPAPRGRSSSSKFPPRANNERDQPFRSRGGEDRPFRSRGNDDKPFRSHGGDDKPFRSRSGEDRPFRSNGGGDDKPFRSRGGDDKPFRSRSGEDRPFRSNSGGDDKPFRSRSGEDRPFRSNGGDDKPFRSNGGDDKPFRSRGGDDKPFRSRSGDDKPFRSNGGFKPQTGKKPEPKKFAMPARTKAF